MILIGLGSNLEGPWGTPEQAVGRALAALDSGGMRLLAASRIILSAPFGKTDQPAFANAVARVESGLSPVALLAGLHEIEARAGRVRGERWGPRVLDLDLLAYDELVQAGPPELPHRGIPERAFVLSPIAEIAPDWCHPVSGLRAGVLLARLEGRAEGAVIG
jgi:2-amino-4-hydroxy-6-hydroxymethyldihydropteridine diphosphokinase